MASVKSREEQEDDPPMSRLFIICNKTNTEEEFRESFSKFGTIEEIWIVKDKLTGEHKGQWHSSEVHFGPFAVRGANSCLENFSQDKANHSNALSLSHHPPFQA